MTTYSMYELEELTGIAARTIRRYIEEGLLPPTESAGRATRYPREVAVKLFAIRRLKETYSRVRDVKRELARMSPMSLQALAPPALQSVPPPPRTSTVPPPRTGAPAPRATGRPPAPSAMESRVDARLAAEDPEDAPHYAERWVRVPLLPGLDLQLREDAAIVVKRIAREIQKTYAAQ